MITLWINNQEIQVQEGSTLLDAVQKCGITIPTLCFLPGLAPFSSCMVCLVREQKTNTLLPACSARAEEGMDIETDSDQVYAARRTALELLLSEHVGDCDGPCQRVCPAHMNIPQMLRQVAAGQVRRALVTIKQEIALPAVTGRICPAPCQNGCRRRQVDEPLAICRLERFVADLDYATASPYIPTCKPETGKKVAIIGAGPAGLATACYLLQEGHACTLFDNHPEPGGMLRYGNLERILPVTVLDAEIEIIRTMGCDFRMDTMIGLNTTVETLKKNFAAIVLVAGSTDATVRSKFGVATSPNGIRVDRYTFQTSDPEIFAGGGLVRPVRMVIQSLADGKAIAVSVNQLLAGLTVTGSRQRFNSFIGKLLEVERDQYRNQAPVSGKNFVNMTAREEISLEQAGAEASRCLNCDCLKSDTCKLRQYADDYQANSRKYRWQQRPLIEIQDHHSQVIYEVGKCIKCGLCVRITESHGERLGLTFIGRGFNVRIGVPLDETLAHGLEKAAAQCAQACPTGALAFRR